MSYVLGFMLMAAINWEMYVCKLDWKELLVERSVARIRMEHYLNSERFGDKFHCHSIYKCPTRKH